MNFLQVLLIIAFVGVLKGQTLTQRDVDGNITFIVHVKESNLIYNSTFTDTQLSSNCPTSMPVHLIVHGWTEGMHSLWARPLINAFLTHGGGCVIFMEYSKYSAGDYGILCSRYELIRETLRRTVLQIGNPERLFIFGFSFGSRLAQGVGYNLTMVNGGIPVIKRMDLCDPAGPGFDYIARAVADPSKAAENVACIHTSNDKGTVIFNCKQDFALGYCGQWQYAATVVPKLSHGLCPYFYINAFTTSYTSNNFHKCTSRRLVSNTTAVGARLGFYNTNFFNGTIFIATSRCDPYVLVNGQIYNYPAGKSVCAA